MKISVLSICAMLLFIQCSKKVEPVNNEKAYYHFKETDSKKLLPYVENQIIKFKNENGNEKSFRVYLSQTFSKVLYGVGMGFFSSYAATYFYYDGKVVQIQSYPDSTFAFSITFSKWPTNTELAESDIYHEYPSEVRGFLLFSYWNAVNSENESNLNIPINYDSPKITMTINDTHYENIFVFNSNNSTPLSSIKNVNVIYYDEKEGIVGFDDLNNNHWRLIE